MNSIEEFQRWLFDLRDLKYKEFGNRDWRPDAGVAEACQGVHVHTGG